MRALEPFFLLVARPAMFWVGSVAFVCTAILLSALGQPHAPTSAYLAPGFLAIFAYPTVCGVLAGAILREFQHSTVAWPLPGARRKLALGHLVAGLAITLVVLGLVAARVGVRQPLMLLGVGLGGYCLGGILIDPFSRWVTAFNVSLVLIVAARSRDVAELAAAHPVAAGGIFLAVAGLALARLFGRSTWRIKPFRPTSPFPGSHWLQRAERFERDKRAGEMPRRRHWRADYLGTRPGSWVRAAVHESYGRLGLRAVAGVLSRPAAIWVLMAAHAWTDRGELSFANAFGRTIYDVLFRPPHLPPFGEGGPYGIVALAIAAAGAVTAGWSPVGPASGLVYPLCRRDRARVFFRCGLVDAAVLLFVVGLGLAVLGQTAGWLVGYELRLDFVPFHLRALLATVVLMPLAHWGGLRLRPARARKSPNTLAALIFGLVGFVAVVGVWSFYSPLFLTTPPIELSVMVALVVISQLLHRRRLVRYFAVADLV